MSVDDKAREEQTQAEREENWGGWLADSLALLDSLNPERPYSDAGPEREISDEGEETNAA